MVSVSSVADPKLQSFEEVAEDVADLLSESKAIEKLALMNNELQSIKNDEDKKLFIDTYNYVTQDTFVNVKRYSSLLPQEVLSEIFNNVPDTTISTNANNKDSFIITINNFNRLNEDEINSVIDEYNAFSEERLSSKMSEIINEDVFQSARVNLNNLIF